VQGSRRLRRGGVLGGGRSEAVRRSGRMAAVLKRLSMSKETSPGAAGAGEAAGAASSSQKSFKEQLSPEAIAFFNEVTQKPFSQQAKAFLSAYWKEVGDQAEFLYSVRRACVVSCRVVSCVSSARVCRVIGACQGVAWWCWCVAPLVR
jgi:hypothetical protein